MRDPVANLQKRIDARKVRLEYDQQHGYLASVLRELKISTASQTLVFSRTSFQARLISPKHPRALYFNDDVHVGWVPRGEVLEIASTDPQLGPVFYTLEQRKTERPAFVRQNDACLQCHASSMTRDTPGYIVRSVFADATGQPLLRNGTFLIDQESPLKERWGGWYVSGHHGAAAHGQCGVG